LNGAAIKMKAVNGQHPLDNAISNIFHHGSPDAITLNFEGGCSYNSFTNIVSEQGGDSALFLKNDEDVDTTGNMIAGIANVAAYISITPNFTKNNALQISGHYMGAKGTFEDLEVENPVITGTSKFGTDITSQKGSYSIEGLNENSRYEVLRINVGGGYAHTGNFLVELSATTRTSNVIPHMWQSSKVSYMVEVDQTRTMYPTIGNSFSSDEIFLEPYMDNGELVFGVLIQDNGTTTTGHTVNVSYEILGNKSIVAKEIKTPTTASATPKAIKRHTQLSSFSGTTENRPTTTFKGFQYFDTTLGKPVWWNGANWVDSNGTVV
jgi:hypothetical protein